MKKQLLLLLSAMLIMMWWWSWPSVENYSSVAGGGTWVNGHTPYGLGWALDDQYNETHPGNRIAGAFTHCSPESCPYGEPGSPFVLQGNGLRGTQSL